MENKHINEESFKHMEHFHDIALRILLIDDKVGQDNKDRFISLVEENEINGEKTNRQTKTSFAKIAIKSCIDVECNNCNTNHQCKLQTIMRLMDEGKDSKFFKSIIFDKIGETKDYYYWKEKCIETYCCPTVLKDFIKDNTILTGYDEICVLAKDDENENITSDNKKIFIQCDLNSKINKEKLNVQIIGVRDVRTALLLMSKYKFDMIFCDYLLDYKDYNEGEREYANQLFEFLSNDYKKEIKNETDDTIINRLNLLDRFRHAVLDNRGPLGKYWIMPVTGFNQTFIQDLYRNHINLIDYRWNISNGADPITTPWQFLYHLNKFIELQLRSCVYQREQLLQFLLYTCEDLKDLERQKDEEKIIDFETFKSFMGSEYATFMQLYGNKLPIQRDALINNEKSDSKSIFATYIWNSFYGKPRYFDVIEFNRLIHKFYYQASSMYNDGVGRQRLNEAFANLDLFVRTNSKIKKIIDSDEELSELLVNDDNKGLAFLRKVIAKCTKEKSR